jgi:ubiquitin thioesterase protein OTUB1
VFLDQFVWAVESAPSAAEVVSRVRDESTGMYLVSYARYLTSGHLAARASEYAPFVPDGASVDAFRRSEVEPMGRDAEHLQIVCLTAAIGVPARIAYLDRTIEAERTKGAPPAPARTYDFPSPAAADEAAAPRVHLLYRPGHYDVLLAAK